MTLTLEVRGVDEARKAINIDVKGQLGRAIDILLPIFVKGAAAATPVVTGSMRAAWTSERKGLVGRMFIAPSARNTSSGAHVTSYAATVSNRYGILGGVLATAGREAEKALKEEIGFGNRAA